MERKGFKKRQLTWRILKNIFLILFCCMAVSAFFGYFYFTDVVKDQKLSDEKSKMQQVSKQITFMMEDIQKFADSIIVDETLQSLLEHKVWNSEFERLSDEERVSQRLVFYNSLRTYIKSSTLIMEDGRVYGSSYSTMNSGGQKMTWQKEVFPEYSQREKYRFSNPYPGRGASKDEELIAYQVKMWDQHHFGALQGTLYLEIYLDYFLDQIKTYASEYQNVCLAGNQNTMLYQQDPENLIQDFLLKAEGTLDGRNSFRISNGYLICDQLEGSNWKLCTVITDEYLKEGSQFVLQFFVFSFLFSMGMILMIASRVIEKMIRPVTILSEKMENISYGTYEPIECVQTGDEIQTLYECFDNMMKELKKGEEQKMEYERQKKEMEFDIMLSQINPHYLYNVLNTVVYMAAARKQDGIVKIVNSLIYSLQETLNVGEHNIETTLEKELELTRCYLNIQEYRYPQIFHSEFECEEGLKECIVPKTIIQPLVENAILHGILPTEEEGTVKVEIRKKEKKLLISVEDDGIGMPSQQIERFEKGQDLSVERNGRKHIGISNVRDRITYLYGTPYGMEIQRKQEGGTKILLYLPLKFAADRIEEKGE